MRSGLCVLDGPCVGIVLFGRVSHFLHHLYSSEESLAQFVFSLFYPPSILTSSSFQGHQARQYSAGYERPHPPGWLWLLPQTHGGWDGRFLPHCCWCLVWAKANIPELFWPPCQPRGSPRRGVRFSCLAEPAVCDSDHSPSPIPKTRTGWNRWSKKISEGW